VHDGKSCLSIADSFQPDAILLDIRLPNLDGLSVLKRLKSKPQTKSIPVVNLSASLNDRRKALDLGANYFVQKPFTAETVLSALDSVLFENTCSQQHSQSKL
jgi:CheY-like chemotaxis protein